MIAHFHPILAHLPIGMVVLAVIGGYIHRLRPNAAYGPPLRWTWLLAAGCAALSSLTGWWLADGGGYEQQLLDQHRQTNLIVTALLAIVAFLKWQQRWETGAHYLGLLVFIILMKGAWSGAQLTHGVAYFSMGEDQTASGVVPGAAADVPQSETTAPDPAAISALRQKGVMILPVAAGSNWLGLNFVNAESFDDRDATLLEPLAAQIVWLKMSGTAVSDSAMTSIAKCTELTRLFLDHTKINGSGLPALTNLKHLRKLNLASTQVQADALQVLGNFPELTYVNLYQTGIDSTALAALKTNFPKIYFEYGKYQVTTLPSDTARLTAKKKYE